MSNGTIHRMATEVEKQAPFATVEEAIDDLREGKFVVVVDAADRENEGDLTIAAQFATPEAINFMATHGRGLICLCLTEDRCDELGLQPMTERNETPFGTAFTVSMPTAYGDFTAVAFRERLTGKHHVALVKGDVDGAEDVLVRVHSECLTGDVFHSLRCDCGEQLEQALSRIASEERGVLLYMAQEGRGIGLLNKLRAYELQENGLDTVEANLELGFQPDMRDYGIGNQILAELGLTTIRILTNNPKKITGIEGFGLDVVEQVPIETAPTPQNTRYLATKRDKLGHKLHHQDLKYEPLEGEE